MRVTLDTNVLAAASLNLESASGQLYRAGAARQSELILSEHMLAELARALNDRYFRERISIEAATRYVGLVREIATMVTPAPDVQGLATHPEDDIVLGTAVSARADYLCTRDRQLLMLRNVHNVAIVSPGELLEILRQERHPVPEHDRA